LSKYSQKLERLTAETRKKEKEKNELLSKTKSEREMLKRNFRRMDKIEKKEKREENKRITTRKQLRKRYLDSLKVGDIKSIEQANQAILGYEISLKLEQQEKEIAD